MNRLLPLLATAVILLTCHPGYAQHPNIILIMTDDQGWMDAGFNGNETLQTPHMDKLANMGIVFDRFYSASPVCSPTRASLITGRNPVRMGIANANQGHMKEKEITLPEILKEQGYTTGHFGKWHLGTLTKATLDANRGGKPDQEIHYSTPSMNGYDHYFCSESKVPTFDPLKKPENFEDGESLRYGWKARENTGRVFSDYGTHYWIGEELQVETNISGDDAQVITDRLVPFIDQAIEEDKPFFSTVWYHTPHLPVVADKAHRDRYADLSFEEQLYYGTITAMDEQIGRLWEHLTEKGIAENTIIMFCSDNGPERNTPGSAGKFRDRKRSLYEGGVRVPAFALWKGTWEGGKRVDFPAVTSDYLPTILDILDIPYPDDHRPIDGESFLPTLLGNAQHREKPIGFIYLDQFRVSWVGEQYKLVRDGDDQPFELYDLVNDPSEQENIIQQFPFIAAKMAEEFQEWLKGVENSQTGADY
ncbi:N-acetylgalactosamine 6-sulfate sulfatase [Echinicola strongylocentroti]|uniref:N-acetylgalactosamine 6-sulfate sulfatase n=1 Tax=Echinicola strongylocentroti TaxID=1795355 RepID=A0A2Z4IJK3_9BACT|nr:sulfatase-like hydrolase/transferase [Echinicola strongylocentroti]AWW30897.1 N-acetylgalactosamine 6-sulfate sulfatase [Echinicola strongylocentroti]